MLTGFVALMLIVLSFLRALWQAATTRPDIIYYRWMVSPHPLILAKLLGARLHLHDQQRRQCYRKIQGAIIDPVMNHDAENCQMQREAHNNTLRTCGSVRLPWKHQTQ